MRKLFTLLLAVAASVGTMFAWDYERVQIGGLYYNLDATNQTAEVTSQYSSYPYWSTTITTANIPASVTYNSVSYSVTSIGDYAFSHCSSLTSVTIPNSVTSIGGFAFFYCTGLTSVTIPNSVTSIGSSAFSFCSGLTSPVYNAHVFAYMPTSYSGAYTIPDGIESIAGAAFLGCTGLTSVTIPNSVTSIGYQAFWGCSGLTSVTIPNSVTSIGDHAFRDCTSLTSVTIPNSVTSIGGQAFYYCTGLTSITCEAITPPTLGSYVFSSVDRSIPLYVPAGSIDLYKAANQWKVFSNILPIGAQPADVTTTIVTPSATTADIAWPQVSDAASYELVIKDKDVNVVCTLIFNAQGQLTSFAFNAPSRDGAPQRAQAAGFSFTVTRLNSGTTYSYTMTAKDNNGNVLKTESGSFTTTGVATAIDNIDSSSLQGGDRGRLILHDGQIFILRGEKVYTLQGQEVR